jgi:hypothetical protein
MEGRLVQPRHELHHTLGVVGGGVGHANKGHHLRQQYGQVTTADRRVQDVKQQVLQRTIHVNQGVSVSKNNLATKEGTLGHSGETHVEGQSSRRIAVHSTSTPHCCQCRSNPTVTLCLNLGLEATLDEGSAKVDERGHSFYHIALKGKAKVWVVAVEEVGLAKNHPLGLRYRNSHANVSLPLFHRVHHDL